MRTFIMISDILFNAHVFVSHICSVTVTILPRGVGKYLKHTQKFISHTFISHVVYHSFLTLFLSLAFYVLRGDFFVTYFMSRIIIYLAHVYIFDDYNARAHIYFSHFFFFPPQSYLPLRGTKVLLAHIFISHIFFLSLTILSPLVGEKGLTRAHSYFSIFFFSLTILSPLGRFYSHTYLFLTFCFFLSQFYLPLRGKKVLLTHIF